MKKVQQIGWLGMATLILLPVFSCSNEVETVEEESKVAIDFVCKEFDSRTDIHATIADLKDKGFILFAHTTTNPNAATPTTTSSDERTVTYDEDKREWTYTNKMYWIPQHTHTFRGYFPADAMTINDTDYNTFEINYENSTQKDIMMASATRSAAEAKEKGYEAVPLTFEHLLAKVNIKLKVDVENVDVENNVTTPRIGAIVKGVGLSDIAKGAKYTQDNKWTDVYGTSSIGVNFDEPILIGESMIKDETFVLQGENGETLFNNDDEFLVIPQALEANKASLRLYVDIITPPVWNVTEKKYIYTTLMTDQPLICALPAITWEAKKKYVYIATITQDFEIQFGEITIEEWEDKTMSGTIIIQ